MGVLQAVAFIIILAGVALGIYLAVMLRDVPRLLCAHIVIGAVVGALIVLQVSAIVARPKPDSKLRYISIYSQWKRSSGFQMLL